MSDLSPAAGNVPVRPETSAHALDAPIEYTCFKSKEKPTGILKPATWRRLFDGLANLAITGKPKLSLPGFALATFE